MRSLSTLRRARRSRHILASCGRGRTAPGSSGADATPGCARSASSADDPARAFPGTGSTEAFPNWNVLPASRRSGFDSSAGLRTTGSNTVCPDSTWTNRGLVPMPVRWVRSRYRPAGSFSNRKRPAESETASDDPPGPESDSSASPIAEPSAAVTTPFSRPVSAAGDPATTDCGEPRNSWPATTVAAVGPSARTTPATTRNMRAISLAARPDHPPAGRYRRLLTTPVP